MYIQKSITEFPGQLEMDLNKLSASRRASREGTPTSPSISPGGSRKRGSTASLSESNTEKHLNVSK